MRLKNTVRPMILLLFLTTAGCASGPDYHAPKLPDTAMGPFVSQSPQVDAAAPPDDWWRLYDDPALDAVVHEALAANTDLRIALANLDRARAISGEARGQMLPSTTLAGGVKRSRDQTTWSGEGQAPVQWNYVGGLDVAYELDLFGRVRRDMEAARSDAEATDAAYDAARVLVVAETTRAYMDACANGASLEVARSSTELARQSLDIVSHQERLGSASRFDVERSSGALARAEAAMPRLQAQKDAAVFELAALMGRTPAQAPEAARICSKIPKMSGAIPVGDGTAMLRRRPDIRQAERTLAADTARIGVAVADLYPRVTLGGSLSYLRNDYLKDDHTWSFSFGPLIT